MKQELNFIKPFNTEVNASVRSVLSARVVHNGVWNTKKNVMR